MLNNLLPDLNLVIDEQTGLIEENGTNALEKAHWRIKERSRLSESVYPVRSAGRRLTLKQKEKEAAAEGGTANNALNSMNQPLAR